ncbi:UDP-glucose 4-epimerase family protein [Photobacterium indicum]|uniref:UDP-glucose 4-epimerase family protein n=1 Tax=Photobacterium indicum TaxID=81447 RepID=UPI003D1126E6
MKKILITGVSGFVGAALASHLEQTNSFALLRTTRLETGTNKLAIDFSDDFNVENELDSVEAIIHCAARVHLMEDDANNPLEAYRQVNTLGTLRLAQQAADAGVKRFIFLSSIKVNGESTQPEYLFTPNILSVPTDPYALSKYEAEVGLLKLAEDTGMDVVIIRPPLVYGQGVKANFASMMNVVRKGIPLPLGAINNARSLVYIDNLIDLIVTCISHPKAANQVFMVSDNQDVSTSELLRKIAKAMGKNSRLLPIPQSLLLLATRLLGKQAIGQRLCSSLQVDISKTKSMLNWQPPYTIDEALTITVKEKLE